MVCWTQSWLTAAINSLELGRLVGRQETGQVLAHAFSNSAHDLEPSCAQVDLGFLWTLSSVTSARALVPEGAVERAAGLQLQLSVSTLPCGERCPR